MFMNCAHCKENEEGSIDMCPSHKSEYEAFSESMDAEIEREEAEYKAFSEEIDKEIDSQLDRCEKCNRTATQQCDKCESYLCQHHDCSCEIPKLIDLCGYCTARHVLRCSTCSDPMCEEHNNEGICVACYLRNSTL